MSNRPHNRPPRPPVDGAEPPPEIAALAEEMNTWQGWLAHVGPSPVTFHVSVRQVTRRGDDGAPILEDAVRLIAVGPTGPHTVYLPPALADELAGLLAHYAREARSGIQTTPAAARLHLPNGQQP